MGVDRLLLASGLLRPVLARPFCPACGREDRVVGTELAYPALLAGAVLVIAGGAWAFTVWQARAMGEMVMGLGSLPAFAVTWTVMMAAMMLPSALPLVLAFARHAEGRRGWPLATGLLTAAYLAVWLGLGLLCYTLYIAFGMPWPDQAEVGALALLAAGLYALTPMFRASLARCRELCVLHGPLPLNLFLGAAEAGLRYGLSCVGSSGFLMVTLLLVGMTNLPLMAALAALVFVLKIRPASSRPWARSPRRP